MPKIPSKATIEKGIRVLDEVYAEIDKQIGGEQNTKNEKISDTEGATFLQQRGAASDTTGAAVATVQAYMRNFVDGEVPIDDINKTLKKVTGYLERDRANGKAIGEVVPTWRAI